MPRLPPLPDLAWSAVGAPTARAFDDVYFSSHGGLAESEAVFLSGCDLPRRWAGRDSFAVCELGFGAGLNFLALWRAWKATRLPYAQLHVSSIEAFPLARQDAAKALLYFPEVADLAARLIECWPVRAYGVQRFWFPEDGVSLTLHIGDGAQVLAGMDGAFDGWFLDGFAPAKNPTLWTDEVFAHMARLSADGARLATFTVAGAVRRGLKAAGFSVERKPGFGGKRERLEGRWLGSRQGGVRPRPKRVAIIGAGIAGAAAAEAFVQREVETVVLDGAPALGAGASGNPAGLVMPRLDRGGALQTFFVSAYLRAVAAYERLGAFRDRGVIEVATEARAIAALADLLADPPMPEDWFSSGPRAHSALHPRAGLVDPIAATRGMLAGAALRFGADVAAVERLGEGWAVRGRDGAILLEADAVVLACGAGLSMFASADWLPLELTRGQIEWGEGSLPDSALVDGGYCAPFANGALFGATFDKYHGEDLADASACADARRRNLERLARLYPEVRAGLREATLRSRAALRAATPDRAPIMGQAPDAAAWREDPRLRHGLSVPAAMLPEHRGLFVLGGLGARGLTLAPLLGEALAGEVLNEPSLLERDVREALHPGRFLKRALKRR